MKTRLILAAAGALLFAFSNADATTSSGSFTVSITIASPCGASTSSATNGVTVNCEKNTTPYRIDLNAPAVETGSSTQRAVVDPVVTILQGAETDAYAAYTTAQVTF